MTRKSLVAGIFVILVITGVYLLINGSDDSDTPSEDVDIAFAAQMVPHHEAAVDMAQVAKRRAEHPEVVRLANDIVETQSAEIETLNSIHERMAGASGANAKNESMGMSDSMMGMDMDMSELENATPFDREFIDQMIPHHQGAIRMAYAVLEDGEDQEITEMARAIIAAQARKIARMNRWRIDWYGSPSPSGGAPSGPTGKSSTGAGPMDMNSGHADSMGDMDH